MSTYLQPLERDAQEPPKVWELHDSYKYAPPKVDGESWRVVLEPLLKKDKLRCDAWKDEVQNLLIFAGLFSAVATSFVIESYKSLQADPLAYLLLVITAPRSNASSVVIPPFSPTPSAIRINIFWFMSLVLSLTTVLVGIVSLQWLREHQSYPDLTPKQIFALFHMRSEGLQKWHVPRIFSALPLLLQGALILFFAGMIDFLLSLQKIVAIPIIIIIGLASTFLIATTIIPTFQGIHFYFPFLYSREHPPAQCAYKSPQSHAFRALSQFAFRGMSYLLPVLYKLPRKLGFKSPRFSSQYQHHIIPHIASIWNDGPWVKFDLAWLSIRDAYVQGIHDHGSDLHLHRHKWQSELPLYDIAKGLREVGELEGHNSLHTETFLAAIHYCFEETSLSIMDRQKSFNDPSDGFGNQERRNRYFRRIIQDGSGNVYKRRKAARPATLSDFLRLNDGWGLRSWEAWEVLHHENMVIFLSQVVLKHHQSSILSMHAMELQMRMVRDLLGKPRKIRAGWDHGAERQLPPSLVIDFAGFKHELSKCKLPASQAEFCYQYANVVKSFFAAVANLNFNVHSNFQMERSLDTTFHTHRQMLVLITEAGWISAYVLNFFHKYVNGVDPQGPTTLTGDSAFLAQHMIQVFVSNINFIGEQLEMEMKDSETGADATPSPNHYTAPSFAQGVRLDNIQHQDDPYEINPVVQSTEDIHNPSLLFYVACLYIKPLTQQLHEEYLPMNKVLGALKLVLRRYYYNTIMPLRPRHLPHPTQTPSSSHSRSFGRSNMALLDGLQCEEGTRGFTSFIALEDRWSGVEEDGVERFSERWWNFILSDRRTL